MPTFSVFLECDDKWLIFQTVGFVRCKKKLMLKMKWPKAPLPSVLRSGNITEVHLVAMAQDTFSGKGFFFSFSSVCFYLWSSMSWYFLWKSTSKSQAFRLKGSVFGFRNCRTDDERLWWTCEMYVTKSLFRSKKNIKSWNVTFLSVDETLKEKIYIH